MERIFRYFMCIFFLTQYFIACTHIPNDKQLQKYVDLFEKEYNTKVVYPVIFFNHYTPEGSEEELLGQCYSIVNTPLKVEININAWYRLSPDQRIFLLYHELAHCTLRLDHVTIRNLNDMCPKYLMDKNMASKKCIDKYGIRYYINTIK